MTPSRPDKPATTDQTRPLRADARRNREHIVAVARKVFADLGPDAPLDVITRRAGVGSATLYRHFPTREDLLEAAYRPDIVELARRATELADYFAPGEAFYRWARDYFLPAQEERGVATMLKDAIVNAPDVFNQTKQKFGDAVDSLIAAAQATGDLRPDVTPRDVLRLIHGIAIVSQGQPESRERMLAVLFDGLRLPADPATRLAGRSRQ